MANPLNILNEDEIQDLIFKNEKNIMEQLKHNSEYKILEGEFHKLFWGIHELLPQDKKMLIADLEDIITQMTALEKVYIYKAAFEESSDVRKKFLNMLMSS